MQNYLRRWRALWNPSMYHGWGRGRNYFEGWYFKVVDPTERFAFAVIPGIARKENGEQHAFIQMLDGKECRSEYYSFDAGLFRPSPHRFAVQLDGSFFAADRLRIDLPRLRGELRLHHPYPWPRMLGAPGIMGWYSFVPFMECYHGVVSVDHRLEGTLEVDGRPVDFTGGRGYTEKDWGRSFPSSWIWMQTNHFDGPGPVSLTASVARIPWLRSHFIGYIVGFLYGGRLHRFATYTGAKMEARLGEDTVFLTFRDRRRRLEIVAHKDASSGELISPLSGEMIGKLNESLQATVEVRLYENDRLLFGGAGRNAGLEVAGPVEELLG